VESVIQRYQVHSPRRYAGREIMGKTEAETLADHIRGEILAGTFTVQPAPGQHPSRNRIATRFPLRRLLASFWSGTAEIEGRRHGRTTAT
jgi:hypothetical protein